ncbi:uncharacterized mitochondrial protein AtMg00860-like [Nicotiana sylvestris]|uniref:uncharacterized mitochondrial protein AtMg00860-like n=1 Tax=Nicotiana sylvestris TaxID=4096 RepID=UPI00388C874D
MIVLQNGTEPVNKKSYRYPSVKKDIIEGLVQQMLNQGIIQPNCSPFASPVILVGDLLDELGGSKVFSKIDLRIDELYFSEVSQEICVGLFFDILIYSSTIEDHLTHLKFVFVEMSKHHLFAKRSKCFFGVQRIEYLGYFITAEGVSTDPPKIKTVQNWPTTTTLKQFKEFLGLAGYYRRFIKGLGVICKPLTDLTKKDGFKWPTAADATFAALKKTLIQTHVLALQDVT